jgi:uncharacterized glyoxalase superfamily protein PhnB
VQPATVYPWLTYDDAHAAIDFVQTAFGGEAGRIETAGDGSVAHAELRFGNGLVMVGSAGPGLPASAGTSGRGTGIYIVVENVDEHYACARDAGADVTAPPHDLGYTREYAARDPKGNVWHFGTYQPLEHR